MSSNLAVSKVTRLNVRNFGVVSCSLFPHASISRGLLSLLGRTKKFHHTTSSKPHVLCPPSQRCTFRPRPRVTFSGCNEYKHNGLGTASYFGSVLLHQFWRIFHSSHYWLFACCNLVEEKVVLKVLLLPRRHYEI